MAMKIQQFCENTSLTLDGDFNEPMPPGYKLNYVVPTVYDMNIYRAVGDLLVQSQYNHEVLVDLLKTFSRFQHRGNTERLCTAFTNRTASGKSELMKMLCTQLYTGHYSTQNYTGQDLTSSQSKDGNNLAHTMNKNLLTSFEELQTLENEFKLLCGSGELPARKLYTDGKASVRINSHIIFATNLDPKTSDAAVLSRLNIFERRFQFVPCNPLVVAERKKIYSDHDEISNDLGIQILLERAPRVRVDHGFGYYLMMFLMSDIFLNTFISPVSVKTTNTLKRTKNSFTYNAQPARYILENNKLVSSYLNPLPLEVFDAQALCLLRNLKGNVRNFKIEDALAELKDQLVQYIDLDKNLIFVKFK